MAEKPALTSLGGDHPISQAIASLANGTSDEVAVWINDTGATVTITKCGYVPDTAVTGNTTNNFILQFRDKGTDGTGTTGITSAKTYGTGVDMTIFNEDTLTLSTTAADLTITNGSMVALNKTETGSGLTLPAGIATLTYKFQ